MDQPAPITFCSDAELGYERSRTPFVLGGGLELDEAYRLAHLPLIAPTHPRAIEAREGAPYVMGRHDSVFSLVLPIPDEALQGSEVYQELKRELDAAPFGPKISWDLLERRKGKVHATICSSLAVGAVPTINERHRRELANLGPVRVEIRGLFSGNVNVGRLYLKAYPEMRSGTNVFRQIQRILNRRETDLYVAGIYNLTDDLDPVEADALAATIKRWWDRPILQLEVDCLWLMSAMDDLVLDSTVVDTISLI